MAIETYEKRKQEVISWSHRGDIDLKVETFISMAETEMYANDKQTLQIRTQETLNTQATSGRTLPLPTDFLAMRSIRVLTGSDYINIRSLAPQQMQVIAGTGFPHSFTVTDQIEFNITPDSAYDVEIQYYALPLELSDANQSNAVLADNPNVYLFGTMAMLYSWAVEEQLAVQYYGKFMVAISGANKKAKKGRYGPAPAMTPAGSTP